MQAIFPSFPAFFAQSPCSPANIVPAAKAPAATRAMNLVIVEPETASAGSPFNFENCLASGHWSRITDHFENRSQGRHLATQPPVPDFARQPHRSVRHNSQCE